jgi:chemotaxis protein CheZ
MSELDISVGLSNFEEGLRSKAEELVLATQQGDMTSTMSIIQELQEFRHHAFYNEVGQLTRGLHEAIKSFSASVDVEQYSKVDPGGSIPIMEDATERLNYVIELTEKTAHETMDRVDKSLLLVAKMDDQTDRFKNLLSLVGQLEGEYEGLRGVYDRTCQLEAESASTVTDMREQLTEILVAQSSQDLSGQLIRKVITLVTQLEASLVHLVDMASKVETISGVEPSAEEQVHNKKDPIAAEGPQLAGRNPDVATCQDDVDDLLSSLGF